MPRPIVKRPDTVSQSASLSANSAGRETKVQQASSLELDRLLRRPRSKEYMDAIHKLDAGGHVHNKEKVDDIINTIKNEFPEVELNGILLGYVAICYLGKPYEVHTLDLGGQIIEHYKAGETLPDGLEKARGIAMYGGYDYIEVYVDCLRAISSDGTVSVIKN